MHTATASSASSFPIHDVVVVGAGFGGLSAALHLADTGAHVALCEALTYPGGCASTFTRDGVRFEAGATLFAGFGEGQLMQRWVDRYDLDISVTLLDPVVSLRAPGFELTIPASRQAFVERLCALPGAPQASLRAFFTEQAQVADTLWALLDDPDLLPPLTAGALLSHAARSPRYLPLLRRIGRPLLAALDAHRLSDWQPLRTWLDAACQITVQTSAEEAEAPFALGAMDYFFRGAGHVHGGVGRLASALAGAVQRRGGTVRYGHRVRGLSRSDDVWSVHTTKGTLRARAVVANLIPQALCRLLDVPSPRLHRMAAKVEEGWGAAVLYRTLRPDSDLPSQAFHVQVVGDPQRPMLEGNHLLCSVSSADERRGSQGERTATISTHVHIAPRSEDAQATYIGDVHERMRHLLAVHVPEVEAATTHELPGSPRTFARFTGRPHGFVGGVPRRAGLHNYRGLWPRPVAPDLWLVGDSLFPGQSTLASAIGGLKTAQRIATSL